MAWHTCERCHGQFKRRGLRVYRYCGKPCAAAARRKMTVTKEWLAQKYLTEQLGCPDIARELGVDAKTVLLWLRQCGIQTRPRGHLDSIRFKPGQVSPFKGKKHTDQFRAAARERALADGRLPWGKGRPHPHRGKRGAEVHSWRGGRTPERQAFYASDSWKRACVAVWHRADAKCERCVKDSRAIDRAVERFHVHHIVSFQVRELRAEPSNLVLLCEQCHRWVHSNRNTAKEFIRDEAA